MNAAQMQQRMMQQVETSIAVKNAFFQEQGEAVMQAAAAIGKAIAAKKKLLICGNGGSAADAQHFAGEMVGRFLKERRPLPAVALSTDTSILTAVGNDYGYDAVFSRQVEALGQPDDILIAISTSGNSPNVLTAVEAARAAKMQVISFTGKDGGKLGSMSDIHLNVRLGENSPRIQETHITLVHVLVDLVDEFFLENA